MTALEENLIFRQARQMEQLRALTPEQKSRVQWFMRERGMSFENAHRLMLEAPKYADSSFFRLVSINLPSPSAPKPGRRLTRRQRRQYR